MREPIRGLGSSVACGASCTRGAASGICAPSRTLAFTRCRPDSPGDVAVGDMRESRHKLVTSINEDLLSDRTVGHVEEIWYESSKDGRKIQGWIVKPPDFDPAKKYPLILEIHGGPFATAAAGRGSRLPRL